MSATTIDSSAYEQKRARIRRNFLRKRFSNGVDLIRFYWLMGRVAAFPILGRWFVRPILNLYTKYIDNNGVVLPFAQIEEIIASSHSLFVEPCDCRLEFDKCDAPLYTCIRINLAAEIRQQDTGKRGISKDQALAIAKNAAQNGLVFCLEQCIQPYDFNICMCCPCCCIVHRFKYELGHDAFFAGPYIPIVNEHLCKGCGECLHQCRYKALKLDNGVPHLTQDLCLGCGGCAYHCPEKAIVMEFVPSRIREQSEPGRVRMMLIYLFMYTYMFPMFILFRLFAGSHQFKREMATPTVKDGALSITNLLENNTKEIGNGINSME